MKERSIYAFAKRHYNLTAGSHDVISLSFDYEEEWSNISWNNKFEKCYGGILESWCTTTEQAFGPGHLSWLPLGPGPKSALVSGPTASWASEKHRGIWSRLEPPTGTEGHTLVPGGGSNQDQLFSHYLVPVGSTTRTKDTLYLEISIFT